MRIYRFVTKIFVLGFTVLWAGNLAAQDVNTPKYELPGTEIREFRSELLEQDYKIYVSLPRNYDTADSKYPVVFLLDADWYFAFTSPIIHYNQGFGELPRMILIGIGYGDNGKRNRNLDYTIPAKNNADGLGGADDFHTFLTNELIPFVHASYKTDPDDMAIAGHSFGGLFVMYSLLKTPELFDRYLAASPSFWFADDKMFSIEEEYFASGKPLKTRLYTSVGEFEPKEAMVETWLKFTEVMKKRNYEGLELDTSFIEGEGHQAVVVRSLEEGLRKIYALPGFSTTPIAIDDEALKSYVGEYKFPNVLVKVTIDSSKLFIQQGRGRVVEYFSIADDTFYSDNTHSRFTFNRNNAGEIISVNFRNKHRVGNGRKIN